MRQAKQWLWDEVISVLATLGVGVFVLIFLHPCILPEGKEFETAIAGLILYFGILYNVLTYKISADKFSK